MSRTAKKPTLERLAVEAKEATEKWLAECSIEQRVVSILERNTRELVAKLLGFEYRCGEWRVDNCNGRAGESAAGDYLRQKAGDGVKEWLDSIAGNLPPLPKSATRGLVSRYHELVERYAYEIIRDRAHKDARKVAEQIISEAAMLNEPAVK